MKFIAEELEEYCKVHSTPPPLYLEELERETHLKTLAPVMISGYLQGRLLSLISKLLRPEKILEIGTFTGYSALCLAEGLKNNGELHTIEVNDEFQPLIQKYVNHSPYSDQIHLHIGKAEKVIPELEMKFDLVFIDAGKEQYSEFYHLAIEKLNAGGCILADNVLWSGKVLEENPDEETKALIDFSKMAIEDHRVEIIMLPVRDGISIIRKR